LAQEIARAIFEQDGQAIFNAFRKILRKGSPYGFQVLSDRAYGKLKERVEVDTSPYREMSEAAILTRIAELEKQLGIPPETAADSPDASAAPASKPN
jgi:hypothetical protein